MNVLDFLSGLVSGSFVTSVMFLLVKAQQKRDAAAQPMTVIEPGDRSNLYGHPWPPVRELWKQLPQAPLNHAWETQVLVNRFGQDILQLALVNLLAEENVASQGFNLTYRADVGSTWAHFYRDAAGFLHRKWFDKELIGPMVDWATAEAKKVTGGGADYRLG